jgi:hypothetical protein
MEKPVIVNLNSPFTAMVILRYNGVYRKSTIFNLLFQKVQGKNA